MDRARRWVVSLAFAAMSLAGPSARAEEPKVDTADGPSACRDFDKKNEKELADWQKQQPAVPYAYPREDTVLGAPWGPFFKSIGTTPELFLATVIPHVGAQYRAENAAIVVAWPWSFPIGPAYTCSRKQGSFVVRAFKSHRAMLEPGITTGQRGTGFFTRPGYRFIYHPSDWVVGAGGGIGSTLDIAGSREPFRYSVSPEGVLQFGHCCDPSYFILSVRYDHYFAGTARDTFGGTLGFTYF